MAELSSGNVCWQPAWSNLISCMRFLCDWFILVPCLQAIGTSAGIHRFALLPQLAELHPCTRVFMHLRFQRIYLYIIVIQRFNMSVCSDTFFQFAHPHNIFIICTHTHTRVYSYMYIRVHGDVDPIFQISVREVTQTKYNLHEHTKFSLQLLIFLYMVQLICSGKIQCT